MIIFGRCFIGLSPIFKNIILFRTSVEDAFSISASGTKMCQGFNFCVVKRKGLKFQLNMIKGYTAHTGRLVFEA
jgi:hypothetical protein